MSEWDITWSDSRNVVMRQRAKTTDAGVVLGEVRRGEKLPTPGPVAVEPSIVRKASAMAQAFTARAIHGPTSELEQARRRAACTGRVTMRIGGEDVDVRIAPGCSAFEASGDEDGFCRSCGCPEWRGSQLSVKWTLPGLRCPMNRWVEDIPQGTTS